MMSPIAYAFLKFAMPAAGAAILLVKLRHREFLAEGFRSPGLLCSITFIAIYLGWMLGTDALVGWRGPWDFQPWREAPLAVSIFRVLGVVVAGPILEELVFRGVAFGLLVRTRLGAGGAVVATALIWSLVHVQYSAVVIAIIFVSGLVLGLARWRSGSIFLPVAMHMLWNLYAIW
jgi:membrane protease YdiL (CAAX protease family)